MSGQVIGSKGKPNTLILLGEHNIKMTSNDLLLSHVDQHIFQLSLEKLLLAVDDA